MIQTSPLRHLAANLSHDLQTRLAEALQREGNALAASLADTLATPPGGPHAHPWRRTGTLHDSIVTATTDTEVLIASNDPVALLQEHGTARMSPRPSFGPLAALAGPGIAHRLGEVAILTLIGD